MFWLIMVVLGGVAVWQIALRSGMGAPRLECPSCDLYIVGARPTLGGAILCSHCREFAVYEHGKLTKVAPDFVAPDPLFCAELPLEPMRWPARCAVCPAPAVQAVDVQIEYEEAAPFIAAVLTRVATAGLFKAVQHTTVTIEVPHCMRHSDGAALVRPYEPDQLNFGLVFRAHAYFKQFRELNRVTARKATAYGGQLDEPVR